MHGEAAGGAACRPPLYSCHDGRCVPPTSLCDDVTDCQDGSDEGPLAGCSWVKITPLSGDENDKMPAGILAAIIVCSVLAVVAAVIGILLLIYTLRRKKQRGAEADQRPQNAPDNNITGGSHGHTQPVNDRSVMTNQSQATYLLMTTREPIVNGMNPLPVNQSPAAFHGDEIEIAYITGRITQNPPELGLHQNGNSDPEFIPRPVSVTFGETPEDGDLSMTLRSPSPAARPEPPTLPPWKNILTRSYPTHTGLARPSPSTPSLNGLDRVPEAPSIGSLHHYPGTHGSTDVHTHSLPDVSYMSAFQKVSTGDITRSPANFTRSADHRPRSAGNFTRSMTNLTITGTGTNRTVIPHPQPEHYQEYTATAGRSDQDVSRSAGDLRHTSHMTYSHDGGIGNYSRSASVPLGYPSEETNHYAVPLSVYKTPPPPRSVLTARHHDIRESYY